MKPVYAPNYYTAFRCIASACRHSCCVGWEIDVDEKALARYDHVPGPMGDRLRAGIDREADTPCFILDSRERCPFLNENGLCDLITELGEESLCRICADHPRFRHILYDRVELGLGLCCEAAAMLILGQTEPLQILRLPDEFARREEAARDLPDDPDPIMDAFLETRDVLFQILRDRTRPLFERICHMLTSLDIELSMTGYGVFADYSTLAAFLRGLERLDPAWDPVLDALAELPESPMEELWGEESIAFEQLLGYFLYRYMTAEDDGRLDPVVVRVMLAVLATAVIHAVYRSAGGGDLAALCEAARMFSSEIEYSEENLERLMDEIEESLF